jgi:ribosomal protein L11 methyltransferase
MNWLEVSLVVDGELAEAVAEVLARFAPNGVVIESTAIEENLESGGSPVGPLRVCAYLPMDTKTEKTRQQIEESLWYLGRIQTIPAPIFKPIQEVNWADNWKEHYHPIPIGKSLIIVPPWLNSPDKTRISIQINPGMAFGTGTHPSTQLCLEMLEDHTPRGGDILDIGCGSGILSIAAVKLGAERAFGVDVNPDAILNAYENAGVNGVEDHVVFARGSLREVKSGLVEIKAAPLVMANILAHILKKLLDGGLGDLVSPGGTLLLSGILEEQMSEISTKVDHEGFHLIDQLQVEDWVAIAVQR